MDGELIAFGDDGLPSFPRLCDRMLHGKHHGEVMLVVFDVLGIDGRPVGRRPYWERRRILEDLALESDHGFIYAGDDDGEALWKSFVYVGLDVVAQERAADHLPGRAWLDQYEEPRLLALPAELERRGLADDH